MSCPFPRSPKQSKAAGQSSRLRINTGSITSLHGKAACESSSTARGRASRSAQGNRGLPALVTVIKNWLYGTYCCCRLGSSTERTGKEIATLHQRVVDLTYLWTSHICGLLPSKPFFPVKAVFSRHGLPFQPFLRPSWVCTRQSHVSQHGDEASGTSPAQEREDDHPASGIACFVQDISSKDRKDKLGYRVHHL